MILKVFCCFSYYVNGISMDVSFIQKCYCIFSSYCIAVFFRRICRFYDKRCYLLSTLYNFEMRKHLVSSCYRAVPGAIWEIFYEFFIFCNLFHETLGGEIIVKYEKWVKYLMLHKTTYNNYFIVKCLLKSNVSRVILLTNCI